MPTFDVFIRCGAKSSSSICEHLKKHGGRSPATRANVTGVVGTNDGIVFILLTFLVSVFFFTREK